MKIEADGSFSDGFRTNVLPQAMAVSEHPHRDHCREVERRDARDDTERLADLEDVHAGRRLLGETALEQVRDAGGELEVLEPAGDLTQRVRGDLAVLGGQQRRDLLAVLLDQVPDAEHDLGPPRERRRAPGGERRLRRGDGRPHLLDRREVDVLGDRARGGVVDRTLATRGAGHDATVDPVADPSRGRGPVPGRARLCDLRHGRSSPATPPRAASAHVSSNPEDTPSSEARPRRGIRPF